jgi:hypothetical protein
MASVLSAHMAKYAATENKKPSASLVTKRQRRTAIEKIVARLEAILAAEESYRDNIPANLQSSTVADNADLWIKTLEDVIDSLSDLP